MQTDTIEKKAITLTLWANFTLGLLGIGFSLYTDSEAILLDGLYSFVNFLMGLITLRVSKLVMEPGNEYYPFGYAMFEPLLNLAKGLIITSVCFYALITSVEALLTGGREIQIGSAVIYAAIASVGCLVLALILPGLAKKSASPIVAVDAKNWIIDSIISIAVLLGFVIVFQLQQSPYAYWLPYIDPLMVIILVIASISIPFKIVKDNLAQIIGKAPAKNEVEKADTIIKNKLSDQSDVSYHIRSGRFGRLFYIQIYIIVENNKLFTIDEQDRLRLKLYGELKQKFPHLAVDVIFTSEKIWVARAIK